MSLGFGELSGIFRQLQTLPLRSPSVHPVVFAEKIFPAPGHLTVNFSPALGHLTTPRTSVTWYFLSVCTPGLRKKTLPRSLTFAEGISLTAGRN